MATIKNHTVMTTPIGKLGIQIELDCITAITFLADHVELVPPSSALGEEAVRQLNHYFHNPKITFDLPLHASGTPFQQRVWRQLATLSPGSTTTYGELAQLLHTGPRAIGNACRYNRLPIIIPCHRVLAKNQPGGFMGQKAGNFTAIKRRLLAHESKQGTLST